MTKFTEKELADAMLEMRKRDGRTQWRYFRNRWRGFLFFTANAFLLVVGAYAHAWWFCGFILGAFIGAACRDFAGIRSQQAAWPFSLKIIDWQKVEKIANGEPSA